MTVAIQNKREVNSVNVIIQGSNRLSPYNYTGTNDPFYEPYTFYNTLCNDEITYYVYDHSSGTLTASPGNTRITYTPTVMPDGLKFTLNGVYDYYPYGKILREYVQGPQEKYLTTHHQRDEETGLDYRGARFYDCDIARFLSLDPLAVKNFNLSPFNYTADNPISYIDPDGRDSAKADQKTQSPYKIPQANLNGNNNSNSVTPNSNAPTVEPANLTNRVGTADAVGYIPDLIEKAAKSTSGQTVKYGQRVNGVVKSAEQLTAEGVVVCKTVVKYATGAGAFIGGYDCATQMMDDYNNGNTGLAVFEGVKAAAYTFGLSCMIFGGPPGVAFGGALIGVTGAVDIVGDIGMFAYGKCK